MKKFFVRIISVIIVMCLFVTPVLAQTPPPDNTDRISPKIETPTHPEPKSVPQEIQDLFKDGMSIEDFLAANKGPIPNALLAYANLPVTVIVQLESPSLVSYMEKQGSSTGTEIGITSQQSYVAKLTSDQDALLSRVSSAGINAVVISRYTKALNGFMARVAFKDLQALRSLTGVKSVARAPEHTIESSSQGVPIDAAVVQAVKAIRPKGTGVRIAIIDTGIDYTHKLLGGDGDPDSYSKNDPTKIEPGTFPTLKVIGGYDFAGTNYDAANKDDPAIYTPVPDPDPLDENGHGTHVSSIAAGVDTTGLGDFLVPGVAPDAKLYALKIFGATGSTNLVVDAIEWAMDPNQDGSVSDHVDVINMSLGSSFGPAIPDDPEFLAVEAANTAGIFVVASSGNAGDVNYVTGSPANTDSALSVASSTTAFMYAPFIAYTDPADSLTKQIPYTTSDNAFVSTISGDLVSVTDRGNSDGLLCDVTGVSAMTDEIALIQRGTCPFADKINNAQTLGAKAAIIYNDRAGTISMATGDSTLPAGSILQSDGEILKGLTPLNVVIGPDSKVAQFSLLTPAHTLSDFSSRGPRGFDSMLKPEITAPGSDIFAAQMGSGNLGISMSGTSMAAPYVAGAAALMKQVHPTWTNEQIKAALMNNALDLADAESSLIPKQGAGEVDIDEALQVKVVAVGDPKFVSLNWGLLELHDAKFSSKKSVTLHNFDTVAHTFNIGSSFTSPVSDGATLTPDVSSITIPANSDATVKFTLTLDVTKLPIGFGVDQDGNLQMEEYYGFVTFEGTDPEIRLPFYFVPRPYPEITKAVADTKLDFSNPIDFGYIDLEQAGPVESNLWAYPVVQVSDNNPDVMDMADLRYVGMDSSYSPKYGDLIVPAFNMWAPQHANQAYWSEVDLWIYGDAPKPVVNFNYNYADFSGASYPTNDWVVIQVDQNDGNVYLASPYTIGADFNSGFQEWYLPTSSSYVTSSFNYEVYSYDWFGKKDFAGAGSFDVTRPPLAWNVFDAYWSPLMNPTNQTFSLFFRVNDLDGYLLSNPKGIMLVDYNGKPGIGQATYWPIDLMRYLHLPLIAK